MKIGLSVAAVALLTVTGAFALRAAQRRPSSTDKATQALYKWFDGLDYGVVRTGQFVKLRGEERHRHLKGYGFIGAGANEAVGVDLERLSKGIGNDSFQTYEPANLEAFARSSADRLKADTEHGVSRVRTVTEAFVLARACEARGLNEEANTFIAWAKAHPGTADIDPPIFGAPSGSIPDSIASSAFRNAEEGLDDQNIDYQRQFEAHRRIARLFDGTRQGVRAKLWVEAFSPLRPLPPNPDTDVVWLIKALPLENAVQAESPGSCEVFSLDGGSGPGSPAHKLAQLGPKAVPELIRALSDNRPTLCYAEEHRLPVSELARQTLSHISGCEIALNVLRGQDRVAIAKKQALDWLAEDRKEGDFAMLCKEVGDPGNGKAAAALEQRYPRQASEVIAGVLHKHHGDFRAFDLINALSTNLDPVAVKALREEARTATDKGDRVTASMFLGNVDKSSARQMLINELGQPPAKHESNAMSAWDDGSTEEMLLNTMAADKNEQTLTALIKGFASKPPSYKVDVLANLQCSGPPGGKDYNRALEEFLVGELDDRDAGAPLDQASRCSNPEIGDMAAYMLSWVLPAKYHYVSSDFEAELLRQRAQFKNIWRTSQSMQPLPLPGKESVAGDASHFETVDVRRPSAETAKVAQLANAQESKPLDWMQLRSLLVLASQAPLTGHRCIRVLVSRDASGHGLTLTVDCGLDDKPGSYPGSAILSRVTLEGKDQIDGISGGLLFDGPVGFGITEADIKRCLAVPSDKTFSIECTIWPNAQL